jgi:TetR/AcrR family transcriptional repressor of nem operon
MSRPREFNMDTALQGAMDIFWRQGFAATNLPDLLTAMGLTRGSFYKAFTDKETAYLRALDFYDQAVVTTTVETLSSCETDTASACLSLLFAPSQEPGRGCFICNAMVELAPVNHRVAVKANLMSKRLRKAIEARILKHRPDADPAWAADAADVVLHLYFGHQAMGKSDQLPGGWPGKLSRLLEEPQG